MKLALVTNYPPDKRPLSEYGFHLAKGLQEANPDGEVTILSGKHQEHLNGEVRRWEYGSVQIPRQIVSSVKELSPDVVLINTLFTSWGGNIPNLAGLLAPIFLRRAGYKTITLVHHLPQTMDAKRAGYKLTPLHHIAIDLACRAIATSDTVCFLLERDMEYFESKYRPKRTELMHHGILGKPTWLPPPTEARTVLAFGKWGRSKNPEPLLRIYKQGKANGSLVVAGGSSHTKQDFMGELQKKYASPNVTFTGYVEEEEVANLFHQSSLVVLPYEENTGISGVLLQTCQFGRVPLLRRLPVFEQMVRNMGLTAYFYDTEEDMESMLCNLLSSPQLVTDGGFNNFNAVSNLTMEKVTKKYWLLAQEMHHQ